jgi:hypothetical protein
VSRDSYGLAFLDPYSTIVGCSLEGEEILSELLFDSPFDYFVADDDFVAWKSHVITCCK